MCRLRQALPIRSCLIRSPPPNTVVSRVVCVTVCMLSRINTKRRRWFEREGKYPNSVACTVCVCMLSAYEAHKYIRSGGGWFERERNTTQLTIDFLS